MSETSVLGKTFLILDSFSTDCKYKTIGSLAEETGIPKSTVYRLVRHLIEWGALQRIGGKVTVGTRLFEIGTLMPLQLLRETAMPFLEDLHRSTREATHLAVLDGSDVLYVEKLGSVQPFTARSRMGGRVPAYSTAVGKALLAHSTSDTVSKALGPGLQPLTQGTVTSRSHLLRELADVKAEGLAYDREETVEGVTCIAAPIFGRGQTVAAGVSVMAPSGRLQKSRIEPAIRVTSMAISRALRKLQPIEWADQ